MENLRNLHNEAMDKAQLAQIALSGNDKDRAMTLFAEAFETEKGVALEAYKQNLPQPGVSILLQSAAHLAATCGEKREAEKLIGLALTGDIPSEIAEDLRSLLAVLYTDDSEQYDTYTLQVPANDRNMLTALSVMLERLGCSLKKIQSVTRKTAAL